MTPTLSSRALALCLTAAALSLSAAFPSAAFPSATAAASPQDAAPAVPAPPVSAPLVPAPLGSDGSKFFVPARPEIAAPGPTRPPVASSGFVIAGGRNQPSLLKPFVDGLKDLRNVPTWNNAVWLAAGAAVAAAARPFDDSTSRDFSAARTSTLRPGTVVGGTPLEMGAAFAAYAVGRATDKPRVARLGADLIRAQVVAELVTTGIKQTVRRSRPDGTNFSFPSGHTAVSFASATVIQQHFGWKAGIPAYAVASYVAASRVHAKRHFLSDVAFGATIGIMAGRTVTIGGRHKFLLTPTASLDGGGISLTWLGGRR